MKVSGSGLSDIKTIILAAAAIAAVFSIIVALGVLLPTPRFLLPEGIPMGWANVSYYGRKVATLEAAYKKKKIDQSTTFGFILGASAVREGFDPEIVSNMCGKGVRWVVFSNSGGCLKKMEYLSRPLFMSRVKPAVAVLGIYPTLLTGQLIPPHIRRQNQIGNFKDIFNGNSKPDVDRFLKKEWVFSKRKEMNDILKHSLYRIRLRLFQWFELGPDALFAANSKINPLGADIKFYRTPRGPIYHLKRQMTYWNLYGWFDPRAYQNNNGQAEALIRVIEDFQRMGTQVFILLLPEATQIRSMEPPEALQALKAVLENAFPADTVPVIDMRDSMSEEYFYDFAHLNWAGRKLFSQRFAKTMETYLEQYQVVPKQSVVGRK